MKNKKVLAGAIGIISIIIAVIAFVATRPTTIDLNDYLLDPVYSGLDGEGTVSISFDDELSMVLSEKMDGAEAETDDITWDDLDEALTVWDLIECPAEIVITPNEELSNGDTITVSYVYDNELFEEYGIKLKGADKTFTVEGLQEPIEIDAFDSSVFNVSDDEQGIHLDFTGASPEADLTIRNDLPNDNDWSYITYESDAQGDIKKGDKITITATLMDELVEEGYVLKEDSTTIECENVAEYITSLEDIDNDTWSKIESQCNDIKKAQIDQTDWWVDFNNGSSCPGEISNFKYTKAHLLSLKPGSETWNHNENVLKIEFQLDCNEIVNVLNSYQETHTGVTGIFELSNIIKNKDGEIEFNVSDIKLVRGYENEDSMLQDEINAEADYYTHTEKNLNWN
jgi:hypothetical protein